MSSNPVTGIQITTPEEWTFRSGESWAARRASSVGWDRDLPGMPQTMLLHSSQPYIDLLEEPPHHYSAPHCHTEPEVMVVLRGRFIFNGRWCETGSLIFVPANEEYWHATGQEACLV